MRFRVARPPSARARAYERTQVLPGPRDADVEQAALLLDRRLRLGHRDGEEPLAQADDEDGVPLEALGRVEGGERDAVDGGRVLGGRPLAQVVDELAKGARPIVGEVDDAPGASPSARAPPRAGRRGLLAPSRAVERLADGDGTSGDDGETAAPRRRTIAFLTSSRSKNRAPPRTR